MSFGRAGSPGPPSGVGGSVVDRRRPTMHRRDCAAARLSGRQRSRDVAWFVVAPPTASRPGFQPRSRTEAPSTLAEFAASSATGNSGISVGPRPTLRIHSIARRLFRVPGNQVFDARPHEQRQLRPSPRVQGSLAVRELAAAALRSLNL